MTCPEAREQLSALVDDELRADERERLDAHLAGCTECRRELERLRATIGLVQGLTPERAPAGFADRVVAAARPAPWPRRVARDLFVPWTLKLPLQAAAGLLIAGLAVLLFRQMPEQRRAASLEERPAVAERIEARPGSRGPGVSEPAPRAESPPALPSAPSAKPGPARQSQAVPRSPAPEPGEVAARTAAPAPGARSEASLEAETKSAPLRDDARGRLEKSTERNAASGGAQGGSPLRTADVRAVLAATDPAGAERELVALTTRLGGTLVSRREEGGARILVLTVPGSRYADFVREGKRLGRWAPATEPAPTPATVRLEVRVRR